MAGNGNQNLLWKTSDFVASHATGSQEDQAGPGAAGLLDAANQARADFITAMEDDLNTADALAAIFELVRAANRLPLLFPGLILQP